MRLRPVMHVLAALACFLVLLSAALATGRPAIERWVIGSGGGHSAAPGATLRGTLGQPIVGASSSDHVSLDVGYQQPAEHAGLHSIFLPLLMRDP